MSLETQGENLKLYHFHSFRLIIQSSSIYIYIVMNTKILQLVAMYKIQLCVSALDVANINLSKNILSDYTMCGVVLKGD